ncbi:MAG: periplasmic heavy metal sensor [Desulfobacteraceae bacterium]
MKRTKATIGILTFGLIMAIAAVAFAHDGYGAYGDGYGGHMMGPGYGGRHMMGPGYGGRHMMGYGYGGGHMMGYGPGYGRHMGGYDRWGALSEENAAKIDAARNDFYKATRELRNKIEDADIALRREMDKDKPDEGKVLDLQKKLSGLQAEFDQKAIAHRLEMRNLMPEGYRGRGGRGGYCR